MLLTLSPIFVTDTKINFGYNFVAPLMRNWLTTISNPKMKNEKTCMSFSNCPFSFETILIK